MKQRKDNRISDKIVAFTMTTLHPILFARCHVHISEPLFPLIEKWPISIEEPSRNRVIRGRERQSERTPKGIREISTYTHSDTGRMAYEVPGPYPPPRRIRESQNAGRQYSTADDEMGKKGNDRNPRFRNLKQQMRKKNKKLLSPA